MTEDSGKKTRRRLWIALAVLALLSPLGIILPSRLGSGAGTSTTMTSPPRTR